MYSLVLMTTMTAGGGAELSFHPRPVAVVAGCYGCSGCTGVVVSNGCMGSCHGGHFHARVGGHGLFGHKRTCHGCGAEGFSCTGWTCFGSSMTPVAASCWGSCNGMGYGSCQGSCHGSGYGSGQGSPNWYGWGDVQPYGFGTLAGTPWACHGGCHGGYFGTTYGIHPVFDTYSGMNQPPVVVPTGVGNPGVPTVPSSDMDPKKDDTKKDDTKKDDTKNQGANINFRLPADAKLYVDGRLTGLSGPERSFTTPPLAPGKYYYDVKAELMVDGVPVVEQKRVIVEAGSKLNESFPTLFAAAERKADAVAGK